MTHLLSRLHKTLAKQLRPAGPRRFPCQAQKCSVTTAHCSGNDLRWGKQFLNLSQTRKCLKMDFKCCLCPCVSHWPKKWPSGEGLSQIYFWKLGLKHALAYIPDVHNLNLRNDSKIHEGRSIYFHKLLWCSRKVGEWEKNEIKLEFLISVLNFAVLFF